MIKVFDAQIMEIKRTFSVVFPKDEDVNEQTEKKTTGKPLQKV